jgi:hypothetical protein
LRRRRKACWAGRQRTTDAGCGMASNQRTVAS